MIKIIQSSWACNQKNLLAFNAGWYAPEYNLMGWALSCLQLKKHYNDVSLYADDVSARMLVDTLQLPYTELVCDLDKLNNMHPKLWALPKIDTYSRQDSPFLHVDGDVFIWEPFDDLLLSSGLITQNLEISTEYYENNFQNLEKNLTYFPPEIVEARKKYNPIYAYNAGIFGGSDLLFFKKYTSKAFEFVKQNEQHLSKINVSVFNIFFEQYLFYSLVKKNDKKVAVLLNEVIGDNQYTGFGEFNEVPHNRRYLHLLGTFKRDRVVCEQLANRLRLDYPEYYYRIIELFRSNKVALKKDFYYFTDKSSSKSLTDRYTLLKSNFEKDEIPILSETEYLNGNQLPVASNLERIVFDKLIKLENVQDEQYKFELKKDIKLFQKKLHILLQKKFINYSRDYLYGRDISHIQHLQMIFENPDKGFNIRLLIDPLVEIAECKYNWNEVYQSYVDDKHTKTELNLEPSAVRISIIPECDTQGYSLIDLDDLDSLILDILKTPTTVNDLINQIKTWFDADDLENSLAEFSKLIHGRIKMAIQSKIIKALI